MQIKPTSDPIKFGHHHRLKTLWLRGKLPTVKFGVYGDKLTKNTISLEHFIPISQGGKTAIDNLGLATKAKNNLRGDKPLKDFLTEEMLNQYLDQFRNVITHKFNGNKYIETIKAKIGGLL